MLFWLSFIIFIIGIVMINKDALISNYKNNKLLKYIYFSENINLVGWSITIIFSMIIICMISLILISQIDANAKESKYRETYNAIIYKVENTNCRDDFGLLSKEIVDEIQEWNEDVIYYQKMQDNFWVGIFIPNIYDQFETIDYTKYKRYVE